MDIKNLYVLMARDISSDAVDNMTSIIKIIDIFTFNVNSKEVKEKGGELGKSALLLPTHYYVGTSWYFGKKLTKDTILNFKVTIISPEGSEHVGAPQESMLPKGIDRANMHLSFDAMPVTVSGKYTLQVDALSSTNKLLARGEYPFQVVLNDEAK